MKPKIVCVLPTCRAEQHTKFVEAWKPLFEKHSVTLITVWDGQEILVECNYKKWRINEFPIKWSHDYNKDLFYRFSDVCRNAGFVFAAQMKPDYILTLDDDVTPIPYTEGEIIMDQLSSKSNDPIQEHLDVLQKRVPLSWMNTAHCDSPYLRGFPYSIRDEAPVKLSHGVWVGVPDFDGETQLHQEQSKSGIPSSLPYYVGPIPKGVLFPLCGMNVMVHRDALPYFYFAPMGPDTKVQITTAVDKNNPLKGNQTLTLNRFGDIWMGLHLQKVFALNNWSCYTGGSTVLHTRASNAQKNYEQEKLGREWNEVYWEYIRDGYHPRLPEQLYKYEELYSKNRERYKLLIQSILGIS